MKSISVKLIPLGKEIEVVPGAPLVDVLHLYGVEFPCGGKGSCGRCKIRVLEGDITLTEFHRGRLKALGLDDTWRLACLSSVSTDITLEVGQYEHIIQADETDFDFIPGSGLGIAFDLGTTTLVGQLLDLSTGSILAVETAMNPQRKYGSDLISRLETAIDHGPEEMIRLIREKVGTMAALLLRGKKGSLEQMVIVGNTVMHHFFCGYDITPLSYYPFNSPDLGKARMSSRELGWENISCEKVEFYPSIGSFVGSDILAGILATGMHQKESFSVLIDLGTNGEIVLGNREKLFCASTAAGPAFEGARISQGMQAATGAISSIYLEQDAWTCRVIGNVTSKGICGSGIIDAIYLFLEKGLIGSFGEILSNEDSISLDANVSLTQRDIQEFQLAKAAIAAGIQILLRRAGIGREEVADVYLAGGFGNYINLEHVVGIGMLKCPVEKMHKLGNAALMGAKMFLFGDAGLADGILKLTEHVSLESEADFQDIFVEHLALFIS